MPNTKAVDDKMQENMATEPVLPVFAEYYGAVMGLYFTVKIWHYGKNICCGTMAILFMIVTESYYSIVIQLYLYDILEEYNVL